MYAKKIYFAGGNFHELQEVFSRIRGVLSATAGYINSDAVAPSYEKVAGDMTGAAMGIEISYNLKEIDLSTLLDILFAVINPYCRDERGNMYRSGVYYCDKEDEVIIEFYMNFLRMRYKAPAVTAANVTVNDPCSDNKAVYKCYAEAVPLRNFYPAEKKHQYYLRKNPRTKTFIDFLRLRELDIIT
ncbi:peptide-methionine (S)-S-oxide reductase [Pectinatus frisingensis]|uniref:peptide-methionine (S)-S-oxide reductase n=1 Tax=Pectinatus frisingensis TaxID=865 RepID=UPI0018C56EAA|nr:peptide-methionine (S)-S-oxide reductase [Pectinatus frisingensis]